VRSFQDARAEACLSGTETTSGENYSYTKAVLGDIERILDVVGQSKKGEEHLSILYQMHCPTQ
jgi:hypothetical protein